jgi:D-tyrosyl-tRNA(Tyr) deacylase
MTMRAVVQRVTHAGVTVEGRVTSSITGYGLVVLLGVANSDTEAVAAALAGKIYTLRILPGEKSCADTAAPLLVISQFTLYADTSKGRRPSWLGAAPAPVAAPLYESFVAALRGLGAQVETGVFGAHMQLSLINDGPVTLILEA